MVEQIDSRQIQLWLAFLDEITDARLLHEYRAALLSEEELAKGERFRIERDRHRHLVTRALVRTVLSRYADVVPRDWRFEFNEYGKPSIAAEHVAASGIEFNVSHTDGLVVLGVTRERALGVDVENLRTQAVDIEIADRYFAPSEVTALRALPSAQQQQRFFEYWTLKESYIKARGMGLSIPLNRFAFDIEDCGKIRLMLDSSCEDAPARWDCWQFEPEPEYVVAAVASRSPCGACPLRLHRTVPLVREQPFACNVRSAEQQGRQRSDSARAPIVLSSGL